MKLRAAWPLVAASALGCGAGGELSSGGPPAAPPPCVAASRSDAPVIGASAAPAGAASPADPFADLVMTGGDCTSPGPERVSRADALADVDALERIVRRGWAGFEATLREGIDFDTLFAETRAAVAALPEPMTVEAFQDALVARLLGSGDGHMALFLFEAKGWRRYRSVGRSFRAYTADLVVAWKDGAVLAGAAPPGSVLVGCDGKEIADILRPSVGSDLAPVRRPVVLAAEPPAPLRCRFAPKSGPPITLDLPMRRFAVGPPDDKRTPAFEIAGGPADGRRGGAGGAIPRLRLRTFANDLRPDLEAFVATAPSLRGARALVVDLRGNGGGADTYARQWFVGLTSGTIHYSQVDRLESEVTLQGAVNLGTCDLAQREDAAGRAEAARWQDDARAALAKARARHGKPFRAWSTRAPSYEGAAPRPFRAPLVMIIDSVCASSCESFLQYAAQVEGSVLLGENSAGTGVFGEVHTYRLPKSGLGLSAGTKYFHDVNPDRVAPEGRGRLPDLWVDGGDAVAIAERVAGCLSKDQCAIRASLRPAAAAAPRGR